MIDALDPSYRQVGQAALIVSAGSAALLAGAFAFQFVGGLPPCVLCLWQRWPHALVMIAAAAAGCIFLMASPSLQRIGRWLLGLSGLLLLSGAGLALFHVGVELHWWVGTPGCGSTSSAASVEALRDLVMATPVVRCDSVAWSLAGISMAGWNGLLSLALATFALRNAVRKIR